MKKHFISILLLLLFLTVTSSAQARLTLGVVTNTAGVPSLMQRGQLEDLVKQLHEKLQEEIVVKEMPDSATVVNWLDQYAALDMALLSREDVSEFHGRFLYAGQVDKDGQVNLVTRQGSSALFAEKVAEFIENKGFSPWRRLDVDVATEPIAETETMAKEEPLSIDEVIEAKGKTVDPEMVTPEQEVVAPRVVHEADALPKEKLVLAVITELDGALQSADDATHMAGYLEGVLPVEIQVKEFANTDNFVEWFMRYRMVDLAVVTTSVAETRLGRDYTAILEINALDTDAGSTELLVGRRGQNASLQRALRQALLETPKSNKGQDLLATLGIQSFREPLTEQVDTVAEMPEPVDSPAVGEKEAPVAEPPVVEEEQIVDLPEPVEPIPPTLPVIEIVPERPMVVIQDVPPEPALPEVVPVTPTILPPPSAPDLPIAPEETFLPGGPGVTEIPEPVSMPELPDMPEVAKGPETPKAVSVPKAPVEKLPELIELPPEVSDEVAEPAVPVEPTTLAAPEKPLVVTPPLEVTAPTLPVKPGVVTLPEAPEVAEIPEPVSLPEVPETPELAEAPVVVSGGAASPVIPVEAEPVTASEEPSVVASPVKVFAPSFQAVPEKIPTPEAAELAGSPVQAEENKIIEEVLTFAEPVSPHQAGQIRPVVVTDEDLQDEDLIDMLGEDTVAALVAQPEIPQELRPPGIPIVRPGRIIEEKPAIDEGLFLTSLPEPVERKKPEPPPRLLPDPEQDQGVLYIVPFVAIMVPKEVNNRIFDQFVDALLNESEKLELEFVILKDGLKGVDPRWLGARKYVTGEIYGYLEETGSDVIDLRAKAKLNYHTPNEEAPVFSYLHPVSKFLNRDTAVIEEERIKLADNIAETLIKEFLGVLKN